MEESKISVATIVTNASLAEKGTSAYNRKFNKGDVSFILLATVLDQCLDQIFMLNGGKVFHQKPMSLAVVKEKLFIEDPIFDHETGKPYDVAFNEKKYTKVKDGSVRYSKFVANQKEELMEHKTFQISRNKLINYNEEKKENERLFVQEKINFAKMNTLKETLLTETRDSQQQIQNLSEVLSSINDENQIILFRDMLRCRYMGEWEKSRSEQNLLSCKQKETALQTIIDNYKTESEKEIRINAEIEMYIIENHEEMETQIEEWMEKYDKETENRNIEMQMLKEKRDDQAVAYKELQETFEEHRKAIENYLEFKETAKREAEYLQMLENMATRIQAWWRGLMVRLKLGPFNPKKGKKGKKGKDKKSGKKK